MFLHYIGVKCTYSSFTEFLEQLLSVVPIAHEMELLSWKGVTFCQMQWTNTVRIAHLRIGYLVGNPEVGNPDPYQLSGLPTFIITLFMCCPGLLWPLKVWCSHVQCILKQYSRFCYFIFIFQWTESLEVAQVSRGRIILCMVLIPREM